MTQPANKTRNSLSTCATCIACYCVFGCK